MIDINLNEVFNTARAALPLMVQRGQGGSLVIGLMKVLAQECGPHGTSQRGLPHHRPHTAVHQRRDLRAVCP